MSQNFYPRGITPRMDLKQLGSQWLEEAVRGPHALSSEETPAVPYMPYKWLPAIQYFDTLNRMREGICLLKGTIVSSVNMLQALPITGGTGAVEGNQQVWSAAQTFPYFVDHNGTVVTKQLEYTVDAYDEDIHSLLIPANGGVQSTVVYSMNDVNMGRMLPDSTVLTASNYSNYELVMPANLPVGVVMDDIYVDYRGQYLNYQPEGKIITNIYKQMEVVYPYIDTTALSRSYLEEGKTWNDAGVGDIKPAIDALYRYFWAPTASMVNGAHIISDLVGNPTVFTTTIDGFDDQIMFNNQVIGQLDGVNSKQPHSLNDLTDTPYGSGMTGTDTLGVEADLFWFVHTVLTEGGAVEATRANILTAIRAGHFGFATLWINLK